MCDQTEAEFQFNIGDGQTLTCGSCNGEMKLQHLEEVIAKWKKIIPWLKSMPSDEK